MTNRPIYYDIRRDGKTLFNVKNLQAAKLIADIINENVSEDQQVQYSSDYGR